MGTVTTSSGPAAPGTRATPGADVVVAEDDPDLRRLLALRLESWGYRVRAVGDGHAALAALRERPADLLLLDVDMPGLDGLAVLAELGAGHVEDRVPVVLLTGHTGAEDVARGLAAGAEDYVRKPFALAEVRARVENVLARSQDLRRLRALQSAVLPPPALSRPALAVAGVHTPCAGSAAGGDWHGVFDGPDGTHVAVVGDVAGHGTGVAMLAAHLCSVVANHAHLSAEPDRLLRCVNTSLLTAGAGAGPGALLMATMACVVFHPAEGRVRWALAGHPAPVLLPGGRALTGAVPGPPLGVLAQPRLGVGEAVLPAGSGLLLYSDGLTEGRRPGTREQFGDEVLPGLLPRLARVPLRPGEVLGDLAAAHAEFTGGAARDDLTLLVCAPTGNWGAAGLPQPRARTI